MGLYLVIQNPTLGRACGYSKWLLKRSRVQQNGIDCSLACRPISPPTPTSTKGRKIAVWLLETKSNFAPIIKGSRHASAPYREGSLNNSSVNIYMGSWLWVHYYAIHSYIHPGIPCPVLGMTQKFTSLTDAAASAPPSALSKERSLCLSA